MSTAVREMLQKELGLQDYLRFSKFIWEEITESPGGTPTHETLKNVWELICDEESYDARCVRKYGANSFQTDSIMVIVHLFVNDFCSARNLEKGELQVIADIDNEEFHCIFEPAEHEQIVARLYENDLVVEWVQHSLEDPEDPGETVDTAIYKLDDYCWNVMSNGE